jgi:hypothetical protein
MSVWLRLAFRALTVIGIVWHLLLRFNPAKHGGLYFYGRLAGRSPSTILACRITSGVSALIVAEVLISRDIGK